MNPLKNIYDTLNLNGPFLNEKNGEDPTKRSLINYLNFQRRIFEAHKYVELNQPGGGMRKSHHIHNGRGILLEQYCDESFQYRSIGVSSTTDPYDMELMIHFTKEFAIPEDFITSENLKILGNSELIRASKIPGDSKILNIPGFGTPMFIEDGIDLICRLVK